MRLLMAVIVAVVMGCGGGLDPAMAGVWTGPATYTFSGLSPLSQGATVRVTVTGATARLVGVCPDGSGSLTVNGIDSHASWDGIVSCPPVSIGGCETVVVSYSRGDVDHLSGDVLQVNGQGVGDGCGQSHGLSVHFVGTR